MDPTQTMARKFFELKDAVNMAIATDYHKANKVIAAKEYYEQKTVTTHGPRPPRGAPSAAILKLYRGPSLPPISCHARRS